MSPRELRDGIREGKYSAGRHPPEAPAQFPPWKKARLNVAIRCAHLFIAGKLWHEILEIMSSEGSFRKPGGVTKSRIQQYCKRGVQYFLDSGAYQKVSKRPR